MCHFCTTSVPRGLRSRVHIGFSLPQSERLSNVISPEDVANILKLIEFFAVCSNITMFCAMEDLHF